MTTRRFIARSPVGKLVVPAIVGLASVLPFALLEVVNRRRFHEAFPVALFVSLWFLPTVFLVVLTPIVRSARERTEPPAGPLGLLLRVAALVLIAWVWGGIVTDQMPCLLGVPNCD